MPIAISSNVMWQTNRGQGAVEYMLVLSILVLGLVAAFYQPSKKGERLIGSFGGWYRELAERVARP